MHLGFAAFLLGALQGAPAPVAAPVQSRPAPASHEARIEKYADDDLKGFDKLSDAEKEKKLADYLEKHPQLVGFVEHHKRLVALEAEGKDGKKKVDEYLEAHPRVKEYLKDHPTAREFLKKHEGIDKFLAKHPEFVERVAKAEKEHHEGGDKPSSRPHGKKN